jgi:transcription-repair coupling factor (superfamily II helicase)
MQQSHNGIAKECGFGHAALTAGKLPTGGGLTVTGLYGSSRAFFLAKAYRLKARTMLAVLSTDEEAQRFAEDLKFFLGPGDVFFYPSTEVLPFEMLPTHHEILAVRVALLARLLEGRPLIIVSAARSLAQKVMPKKILREGVVTLASGEEFPMEGLVAALSRAGYSRMSMVEERGEMSVRGGIVDVFPPGYDLPLRIEFFGDQVESIRTFEINAQRSIKGLTEARILPATESASTEGSYAGAKERVLERASELGLERSAWEPVLSSLSTDKVGRGGRGTDALLPLFHERVDTVFDYLEKETIVYIIEPEAVEEELKRFGTDITGAEERLTEMKRFFVRPESLFLTPAEVTTCLELYPMVEVEALRGARGTDEKGRVFMEVASHSNLDLRQDLSIKKGQKADEPLKPLADRIEGWMETGQSLFITAHNSGQAERTGELLEGYGLKPGLVKGAEILSHARPGLFIAVGSLASGFRVPSETTVVVTEEEVFGQRVKMRSPPARKLDAFLTELQDLSVGDHIVHAHHGIGLYKGLNRLGIEGVEADFLLLEYRDGDRLYLPVWRMDLVSRYHGVGGGKGGGDGKTPQLDKLGGLGWARTKKRVKKAVEQMAGELIKLYAEREVAEGFAFSPPERMFREFEASFEYDETPDQARAIEECLEDMEKARPMDRLVCGDVGYGKTEVAIRAAFKAALDGKQTAVLVPTTVLAQQHHETFTRRLAPYPVTVEVLSRFKSRREQKETTERLNDGRVDILIGTHRLLQKDVRFKDLGLIVIDEEHRFGVKQKERLKQLRKSVDVLTLTATPIPRTLHMSLASIRDLSIINTPPEDRLAIKTSVLRFDESVIAEAMEREIKRGGQIFFVHNRIQSIGVMEERLKGMVPAARVATAHGQMNESELEKKMLGFVRREYDILLSTAIIESGLDIPTANTIIINRADRFGLAELYQLRGRVGRSNHRAYAYFVCPETTTLTDEARKRIEVIHELCEPGSGFKIATYDLEIRGAGELLGTSQSGQIAEVGFEMYTSLLDEAVREMKGEPKAEETVEPEINLKVSQYLPEEYIPDTRQRLGFYKRLASVRENAELASITDELIDRFGELPPLAENLVKTMGLKVMLKKLKARELRQLGGRLYITFGGEGGQGGQGGPGGQGPTASGDRLAETAVKLMEEHPKRYRVTPDGRFIVFMGTDAEPLTAAKYILKEFVSACYS